MSNRQAEIAAALDVVPPFADEAALVAEVERRKRFIKNCLKNSGLKVLVLGISGGVDSTTAGRLAQLSVEELRAETGDSGYRFIAVRLPHDTQHDEHDAQDSLKFIRADENDTVNIASSVRGLGDQVAHLQKLSEARRDFVNGNIKARIRMVAQFAIANANNGLVIGTDHAAEAVMGFFTKFGDGAADILPLSGLTKRQGKLILAYLGAPEQLYQKAPTADLLDGVPGQADEDELGMRYEQIDDYLEGRDVPERVRILIETRYRNTEHKRRGPVAPSDNWWKANAFA